MKTWERWRLRRFGTQPHPGQPHVVHAGPAPQSAEQAANRRFSTEALLSLALSALAFFVSVVSAKLAYDERNTPFRTLIYEREIGRAFDAVDILQRQRYDLSVIETQFDVGLLDPADAEKAVAGMTEGFGRIVSESWMYPPPIGARVTVAAVDFNRFAALCLTGRYRRGVAGAALGHRRFVFGKACAALFAAHQASSGDAEQAVRDYVGFDAQRDAISRRLAQQRERTAR